MFACTNTFIYMHYIQKIVIRVDVKKRLPELAYMYVHQGLLHISVSPPLCWEQLKHGCGPEKVQDF